MDYYVVFEYTAAMGGHEGVRTWSSFPSKGDFDQWYTPHIRQNERVLAEGVSAEEAMRICDGTPLMADLSACIENATVGGSVNKQILETNLAAIACARGLSGKDMQLEILKLSLGAGEMFRSRTGRN